MKEVFGAVLSVKDNVSGTLKALSKESKSFSSEVKKAKARLDELDKKRIKEKELKLKSTKAYKAIEAVSKKFEPLRNKAINVVAKTQRAKEKIGKIKASLSKIKENKVVNFVAKGVGGITKAVGKAALVGAAVSFATFSAGAVVATKSAIDFESQMANVGTLLDGDVKGKLSSMGEEVKKVSMDTGVSTENLTSGLYEVVSAFGESEDSVKQLTIAAKAAKAGNAETADSVKMLSAVTKGYGDTSAEAVGHAADLAFETVKLGQTSFSELASSMGSVVPIASSMKVSQEELFGAMATLTGVTGGTAEVSTQLKATMQGFMSPTKEMSEALKKMGYSSGAAALESESLGSILNKLKSSVNGDTVAFANMFSSVEAKNAVLALAGTQAENFASKTEAMKNAAGASEAAFKRQTSSVKELANNIKNKGMVMLMSLGQRALPLISDTLDVVSKAMPKVSDALDKLVKLVSPAISSFFNMFKSGLEEINFDGFMSGFESTIGSISSLVSSAMPAISAIFEGIGSAISVVMPTIETIVGGISEKIGSFFSVLSNHSGILKEVFASLGPAISEVLSVTWAVVGPIIDLIIAGVDFLLACFEKAFPTIKAVIQTTWNIVKPILEGLGGAIKLVADGVGSVAKFISGKGKKDKVGANATGSSFFSGGYTMVGEHGAELVELPTGSKVHTNSETKNMLGSKGVSINISNMTVREEADIEKIATKLLEEIKKVDR